MTVRQPIEIHTHPDREVPESLGHCPQCRSAALLEQAYVARERTEQAAARAAALRDTAAALVTSVPLRSETTRPER